MGRRYPVQAWENDWREYSVDTKAMHSIMHNSPTAHKHNYMYFCNEICYAINHCERIVKAIISLSKFVLETASHSLQTIPMEMF